MPEWSERVRVGKTICRSERYVVRHAPILAHGANQAPDPARLAWRATYRRGRITRTKSKLSS